MYSSIFLDMLVYSYIFNYIFLNILVHFYIEKVVISVSVSDHDSSFGSRTRETQENVLSLVLRF